MRSAVLLALALALVTAACGDNIRPPAGADFASPHAESSVGGAQVARSKSFLLVTSVSMSNQPVASNGSFTLKPKLGAQ
jgi:hypothetical protein